MNSVRLPGKAMIKIKNYPMVEHVYRRAKLVNQIDEVYITTCDDIIYDYCIKNGIKVIKSSKKHENGTTRVAENIDKYDLSHVLILQGDEPLIKPRDLEEFISHIKENPNIQSWNFVTNLRSQKDMKDETVVKCKIDQKSIIDLFRSKKDDFKKFYKIMGIFCFKKKILKEYVKIKPCNDEKNLLIEQIRILKNSIDLYAFKVNESQVSVNIKADKIKVDEILKKNTEQYNIFKKAFNIV